MPRFYVVRSFASSLSVLGICVAVTASPGGAAASLRPYTTPDGSASAGVPSGWQVVRGDNTVIAMTGPNGEKVSLGVTAITQNAPSPGGRPLASGISFVMPYSTDMEQKFTRIWQFAAASKHVSPPQFTFASATPLHVAPILGTCARFLGGYADSTSGSAKFESAMCSFPPDFGGVSKNVLVYAQLPTNLVPQERAVVESVLKSYRIPKSWLARKLAPFYATPRLQMPSGGGAGGGGGGSMSSMWAQANAVTDASDCFDQVIRETPRYALPAKCGGPAVNQ